MKTINTISGGKTSAYIAANYPADYNVFALVRTSDKNCLFPDSKIRQIVSDKIGCEFIGTLEDDNIIYTMLDLEQFIGKKIDWVTGITFDEVADINFRGILPNKLRRFCTTEMKMRPLFDWWKNKINEPAIFRLGFRANEMNRAKSVNDKLNLNGITEFKTIIGKTKNGKNKWGLIEWQIPHFPLIEDGIFKDKIEEYWKDKPVRFAYMNNCIGCFHRNELLLKLMSEKHPNKFNWFIEKEKNRKYKWDTWKHSGHITYEKIKNHKLQLELFEDDFNECDSGYCGL
jgi:hypothetical protein